MNQLNVHLNQTSDPRGDFVITVIEAVAAKIQMPQRSILHESIEDLALSWKPF